jgi:hypothetical protein
VEVKDTLVTKQTQTNVRVELRGWPFVGEEQLVNYFERYNLDVEYRFRFTIRIDARSKIQEVIEETLKTVGITPKFYVDVQTRIQVVNCTVTGIGTFGQYAAEIFFKNLAKTPE